MYDYKVSKEIQKDGEPTLVVISIYEGDVTTEDETGADLKLVPVTRYRRTKKVGDFIHKVPSLSKKGAIMKAAEADLISCGPEAKFIPEILAEIKKEFPLPDHG